MTSCVGSCTCRTLYELRKKVNQTVILSTTNILSLEKRKKKSCT